MRVLLGKEFVRWSRNSFLLCNLEVHYAFTEAATGPYPEPTKSSPHSIILETQLILFSNWCLGLTSGFFCWGLMSRILYAFPYSLVHAIMFCKSKPSSFHYPNNVRRRVHIIKLHTVQFCRILLILGSNIPIGTFYKYLTKYSFVKCRFQIPTFLQ